MRRVGGPRSRARAWESTGRPELENEAPPVREDEGVQPEDARVPEVRNVDCVRESEMRMVPRGGMTSPSVAAPTLLPSSPSPSTWLRTSSCSPSTRAHLSPHRSQLSTSNCSSPVPSSGGTSPGPETVAPLPGACPALRSPSGIGHGTRRMRAPCNASCVATRRCLDAVPRLRGVGRERGAHSRAIAAAHLVHRASTRLTPACSRTIPPIGSPSPGPGGKSGVGACEKAGRPVEWMV